MLIPSRVFVGGIANNVRLRALQNVGLVFVMLVELHLAVQAILPMATRGLSSIRHLFVIFMHPA